MCQVKDEILEKSKNNFDFAPESREMFTTGGMTHISEYLKKYKMPYKLHFGKYAGLTINEVHAKDKFYYRWLVDLARKEGSTGFYAPLAEALKEN